MSKKNIVSFMLSLILCFSMSIPVSAKENVYILSQDSPSTSEIETRGANPPSSRADTHDLSISDYNYQVSDIGYKVFTSKFLTGVTSLKITVTDWKLTQSYTGAKNNELTLNIYDSKKNLITSKTITISENKGSATFTGLSATSKYYICFEVPTNSNRYSFSGVISKK